MLEKHNFAHTINMLNREEALVRPTLHLATSSDSTYSHSNPLTTQHRDQTHSKTSMGKNSELFRRVAIRCICYALGKYFVLSRSVH